MTDLTMDVSMNRKTGALPEFKNKIRNAERHLEKFVEDTEDTSNKIGTRASQLASVTAKSMSASRDYVKSNPVKGVAIAAAAGLMAGSLMTLVMRSRKH